MRPRPVEHLAAAGTLYPQAWRDADDFRADMGNGLPSWPGWCFLPMAGWYAIICKALDVPRLNLTVVPDVARLAALGAWRVSQGIYRFHPEVLQELTSTPVTGEVPCEVLLRLKEWCVYIETPQLAESLLGQVHGFWAHLESDANTGRYELRFLLDLDEGLYPLLMHLGAWTVTEGVQRAAEEASRQLATLGQRETAPMDMVATLAEFLNPLVAMVLYLCSEGAEIGNIGGDRQRPTRPTPTRTKKGWRLFPPDAPVVWNVGEEIGRRIVEGRASAEGTRSGPRPHIRRAHWHGFWSGPLKPRPGDERSRRFDVRWLPPTPVAMGEDADDIE